MNLGLQAVAALMLVAIACGAKAADSAADAATAPAASGGTTIFGEREAAVGLYLLPWQEESRSELDRPPTLYSGASAPINAQQFADRVASDEAEAAHRRMRVEPRL